MTPPSQIAHYRITSKLGEGGMGAVYRATDTKLNRDVAIKVLPPAFAEDNARMQRFEREAQVLASLNHPNIAAIYGIEQSAIVMELVEGEDLKGPLPVDTVIDFARQIAAGLEAAHERGIVHRDLKPANIKVTPDGVVKLLDFGLAKAREESAQASSAAGPTISPTLSLAMTQAGMILGTAAYMAPEQARGKAVDKRADIWAFGVILYELLTGAMLFGGGETVSDSLAAVLTREPDFNALPKDTPPRLRKLIERCLRKDPKQRLRDIGDARLLLDEAEPATASYVAPDPPRRWPVIAAGAAALLAVLLGFGWWRAAHREPELKPMVRLNVDLGPNVLQGERASAWLSPDGRRLAFLSRQTDGGSSLWIRQLDQKDASLLATDASSPFFSPDGQWVGFFSPGKLRKVSVQGGGPVTICDIEGLGDGTWSEDGTIVFNLGARGLYAVSQDGGTAKLVTNPLAGNEFGHRLPHFLPGGNAVLFTQFRSAGNWDASDVELLWLRTGERKVLAKAAYAAQYLDSGHLMFLRENRIFAVPFDAQKGELRGAPAPVVEGIKTNGSGAQLFSASRSGALVYESGAGTQSSWPMVWVGPSGKLTPLVERPARYSSPRFSPDGKFLAASAAGPKGDDLWVFDLERKTSTQLTFNAGLNNEVAWTPDGKYIMFATREPAATWLIRGDGAGGARRLSETQIRPQSFTPDGRRIVSTGGGISTYPLDLSDPEHPKAGPLEWVIQVRALHDAEVSPDGKWVAFVLGVMGREELFVVPYRIGGALGSRWRISTTGAKFPRWSRSARELFYRDPAGRIQVVEYTVKGDSFSAGNPHQWSPARILATGVTSNWDLAPDGKRAVAFPLPEGELEEGASLHVTFLLNFSDELRRRVPVKP